MGEKFIYTQFRLVFFEAVLMLLHMNRTSEFQEMSAVVKCAVSNHLEHSDLNVKLKVKYTLEKATNAHRETRCITVLFLLPRR
jgi:hypothetical protein